MQETFIEYFKNKFPNLQSIILHGSRAKGKEREHSDWDFIVLVPESNEQQRGSRDMVEGQNVEFKIITTPILREKITDIFAGTLRDAQIYFDTDDIAKNLIQASDEIIAQGYNLTDQEKLSRKAFLLGRLGGMIDYIDQEEIFIKYLFDFYLRVLNTWYQSKKNEYSKNLYDAIPQIKEEDPEFFKRIQVLASKEVSNKEKIDAAEWLIEDVV